VTTRVAVVEDQRLFNEILVALLRREPDVEVVATAQTGAEALRVATSLRPHALLLDISLPDLSGIEVARAVRARAPEVRLIALSVHDEPQIVRDMLEAGASGYVLKSSAVTELLRALRIVVQGGKYVSPEIAHLMRGKPATPRLGRRERQVLALIADGKRGPQIAAQLGISPATVEAHRRNIMSKLGVHTVADLIKRALREGLIRL
jgi:DNA-binding NarL/FixJ family response regulator